MAKRQNRALVIVDMQEEFCTPMTDGEHMNDWDCDKPRITTKLNRIWWERYDGIIRAIRHAKKHNWHIFVLEFQDYGETLSSIQKEIGRYHHETFYKDEDDGSTYLLPSLRAHNIRRVYLVGCNSESCVHDTWYGLTDFANSGFQYSVKVYLPGTLTFNHGIRDNDFSFMRTLFYDDVPVQRLVA